MTKNLTFAAIDIGSNAARMQISRMMMEAGRSTKYKKVEYVRYPLQLGKDVFTLGEIGSERLQKLYDFMQICQQLMDLHEVNDYMACATSAMRTASNGMLARDHIQDTVGIDIKIISGREEAELINDIVFKDIDDGLYLHIDVGGGSTELNIYKNREKLSSESYRMGSLRDNIGHNSEAIYASIKSFLNLNLKGKTGLTCIGTGGNISKIFKILSHRRKTKDKKRMINYSKIKQVYEELQEYSMEQLMREFSLNPDRAEVIIPATEIYMTVMSLANSKKIVVPDVGLKDGMINHLTKRHSLSLV